MNAPHPVNPAKDAQATFRLCLAIEQQLGAVAFIELHRHENMLRGMQKRPVISEDQFAAELLQRHAGHP